MLFALCAMPVSFSPLTTCDLRLLMPRAIYAIKLPHHYFCLDGSTFLHLVLFFLLLEAVSSFLKPNLKWLNLSLFRQETLKVHL